MNHSLAFRAESGDPSLADVATVVTDRDNSPVLDEADKAMLAYAEKLTFDHQAMTEGDIEGLREAGFGDENILEVIASVAYRNMSNRLNIAVGAEEVMPDGPPEIMEAIQAVRAARAQAAGFPLFYLQGGDRDLFGLLPSPEMPHGPLRPPEDEP